MTDYDGLPGFRTLDFAGLNFERERADSLMTYQERAFVEPRENQTI